MPRAFRQVLLSLAEVLSDRVSTKCVLLFVFHRA